MPISECCQLPEMGDDRESRVRTPALTSNQSQCFCDRYNIDVSHLYSTIHPSEELKSFTNIISLNPLTLPVRQVMTREIIPEVRGPLGWGEMSRP